MRVVMRYEALGVDVDLGSVQYSKSTKAACHCFWGNSGGCIYSKRITFTSDVKKLFSFDCKCEKSIYGNREEAYSFLLLPKNMLAVIDIKMTRVTVWNLDSGEEVQSFIKDKFNMKLCFT